MPKPKLYIIVDSTGAQHGAPLERKLAVAEANRLNDLPDGWRGPRVTHELVEVVEAPLELEEPAG